MLSTGDIIMNIAVRFLCVLLKHAKYVIREFSICAVVYLQSNHIIYHFSSIFLLLNDVFTLIRICPIGLVLKNR